MSLKPTTLTLRSCALINSLLPDDPELLSKAILSISSSLSVQVPDCLNLIRRSRNPNAQPTYDGSHDEELWYNNNIQMPRLLVALTDHLGITDSIPSIYKVEDSAIDILAQARFFLQAYIKHERAKYQVA